jgi:GTA TIM-barrel-like domain/Putative phage tail protein
MRDRRCCRRVARNQTTFVDRCWHHFPLTDAPRAVQDKAAIAVGWSSGELVDFYYASDTDRDLGRRGLFAVRSPISEPFWALKNLRWWWETLHVPRMDGQATGPPSPWVPRSKPIWFTEIGFPSVNCATNQPNVFIDPKSAESRLPWHSNGAADRVAQRAAIEAMEEFWRNPASNPVSPIYGGPMLGRCFYWCYDARPYPWFPALTEVWSDGNNYRLGHWINGKIATMRLADIVADLCRRTGLLDSQFDASALDDEVVGYVVTERKSIRDMIAVLQTAYCFDAVERDGRLIFVKRGQGTVVAIDAQDLGAADGDGDRSRVKLERSQDTELPIVLSVEQAQMIGQQALREIWQGRETVDLRLSTKALAIDPTDSVEVPVDGAVRRFRVSSVTYGKPGLVLIRGIAGDGGMPEFVTAPTGAGTIPPIAPEPVAPIRVELLDIPLLGEGQGSSASSFYFAACPLGGGGRRQPLCTDRRWPRLHGCRRRRHALDHGPDGQRTAARAFVAVGPRLHCRGASRLREFAVVAR